MDIITSPFAGGTGAYNAMARSVNDPGGVKNAASNSATDMRQNLSNQQNQAKNLQQQLLSQPKTVTPDNFLALKAKQLANMRLGIASTITGASGSPPPVLSSTSLSGSPAGKTKLGQ